MRTYQPVYRFRYVKDLGVWEKVILFPALVSGTVEQYALSDSLDRDAHVTVRIISEEKQDVVAGDVLTFSDCHAPHEQESVAVVAVKDNRFGTKHLCHTKLVCR